MSAREEAVEVLHLDQHVNGTCPKPVGIYCEEQDEANGIVCVLEAAGFSLDSRERPQQTTPTTPEKVQCSYCTSPEHATDTCPVRAKDDEFPAVRRGPEKGQP